MPQSPVTLLVLLASIQDITLLYSSAGQGAQAMRCMRQHALLHTRPVLPC